MSFSTGLPTWTWPDWRKAAKGTRFRSNQTGRYGTYIEPSKVRHDGAIVVWDAYDRWPARRAKVISPARELTPVRFKAYGLVGFDGSPVYDDQAEAMGDQPVSVKIVGGRALYEAVTYYDDTPGTQVKLSRLEARPEGLRQIDRWVDPDTELEIVATL